MSDLFLTGWERFLVRCVEFKGKQFGLDVAYVEAKKKEALLRYRKGEGNASDILNTIY